MAIKPPSNLHRSRSGILHFRIAIPIDVQYHFTNKEIDCSLRTANVREAACAAQALSITFSKLRNNAAPQEVWIDRAEHALALLARQHEASRFAVLIALTRQQQPQLLAWLAQRPLQALVLSAECSACSIARRPYCRAICRQTSRSMPIVLPCSPRPHGWHAAACITGAISTPTVSPSSISYAANSRRPVRS